MTDLPAPATSARASRRRATRTPPPPSAPACCPRPAPAGRPAARRRLRGLVGRPARARRLAGTALVVAIIAVTAGGLRLALADVPEPDDAYLEPGYVRAWLTFLALLRTLAWEEIAVAAVLWLEVQHPARPWYTAALGAALTAYLLITHIAESGADPARTLAPPREAAGARRLPARAGRWLRDDRTAAPGAGASLLRVLAAAAVIAAAALVIPA